MGLSSSVCPEWNSQQWPQAFATSPWTRPLLTVSFRALWAAIFTAHVLWNWWVRGRDDGPYHFIFLTVQASWIEAVDLILQWVVAMLGFQYVQNHMVAPAEPWLVRISMVLNSLSQPLSMTVAVLYWVLIYPGGELPYMDVFLHGINAGLLLVNLLLTRVPFSCARVGWLFLYQIIYVGWTFVHYALRIGMPGGCWSCPEDEAAPCVELYPDDECPIYATFDWHHPFATARLGFGLASVLIILIQALYVALVSCRAMSVRGNARRPGRWLRRLLMASGGLCLALQAAPSFTGVAPLSRTLPTQRYAASKGFGDSEAAPDKKAKEAGSGKKASIMKNKKSSKTKALTKQRLSDLRDKTLALRQKREEELDEYEMGKAMIAKYGREVAVMPPPVAERVAKRGMVIGGSFYATMLAVFGFGIVLFKTQEIIIPPTLMAFVTLALLALAIFGGAYGMMSASWDPDKEGSALGTEEFSENMQILGEGFRKATLEEDYEKALEARNERRKLLEAKEKKKTELLNK
ncbi:PAM68 [Symbiodinium sp. CCMP2592]|nr:PAM68 [Symbiodinium sp. CCMP2592]